MRFFALDNEPDLWNSTHRDVHPAPLSYDEIWQRTVDYASAIKTQDPGALVTGPVPWGWCAYFWSALDGCGDGGPDMAAPRRHPLPRVVPPAGPRLRDGQRRAPAWTTSTSTTTRRPEASRSRTTRAPRAACACARSRASTIRATSTNPGSALLRRRGRPHSADAGMDRRALSRNEARDHRVQLGRRHRHQLRPRAGRGAGDLRARRRRSRGALGRAGAGQPRRGRVSPLPRLRRRSAPPSRGTASRPRAPVWTRSAPTPSRGPARRLFLLLFNKTTGGRDAAVTLPAALHWRARLWRFDAASALGPGGRGPAVGRLARPHTAVALGHARRDPPRFRRRARNPSLLRLRHEDGGRGRFCGMRREAFCPDAPVTRAQMAVFLLKAELGEHYAPPPATGAVFADVPAGAFAAAWIEDLAARGITGGCGGGNYCPDRPVTRRQMAAFLLKAEHGPTTFPRRRPGCSATSRRRTLSRRGSSSSMKNRLPAGARRRRCSTVQTAPIRAGRWRSFS